MKDPEQTDSRLCGLYGRVSTVRQAQVQDGGLDTQFAEMQRRVEYEAGITGGPEWTIVDRYREEGRGHREVVDEPRIVFGSRLLERRQVDRREECVAHDRNRATYDLKR